MLDPKSVSTSGIPARRPRLVRADSQLRNKWLAAVAFLVVVLALLLWGSPSVQSNLVKMFFDDEAENVFRLLVIFYSLFAILAIILITIGIHLIQVAWEIRQSNRFPAPGMRVMRDTWVIRGSRALFLSNLFIGIAVVLIIGGGFIPFYFHALLLKLLASG
ncbi:MAG: hypothetical protein IEMM0001_0433 [bacterium]|nr:MAG: hypothetical protein IEMM0001_0433 [bacterium]HDH08633.1 hypothetical protein [Gammaproteobacteria bacterium]